MIGHMTVTTVIIVTGQLLCSQSRGFSLLRDSIFAFDLSTNLSTSSQATEVTPMHPKHSGTMENYQKHSKCFTQSGVYKIPFRHMCLVSPSHLAVSSAFPWASSSLTACLPTLQIPWIFCCPSILLGTTTASSLWYKEQVLTCPQFWL